MKSWIVAAIALAVGLGACSGSKESRREETASQTPPAESTAPMEGVIRSIDSERLELETMAQRQAEPELFERTDRSIVVRDGREVSWSDLQEGDAVRVSYDPGIFGPDRVTQVEVISNEEMQPSERGQETPSSPYDPSSPHEPDEPLAPRPVEPMEPPGSLPDDDRPGY